MSRVPYSMLQSVQSSEFRGRGGAPAEPAPVLGDCGDCGDFGIVGVAHGGLSGEQ
eukprot:CAMPEP_0116931492 /NCGR_PEP_ID=MMETSP0467-20121206/27849_1 /TAXON_ID=283647 /ORGANISM="Mesodinium pulex, Strain SPMC105" /LENGTH=54 /DNA_ID=CAMNT_0004611943 /DNA_START=271 /DNA_END=435 /DNA_ORIENTATION=-